MNVLVTGGLGFIGHQVVKRLQDHDVAIIDNRNTYGIVSDTELSSLVRERREQIHGYSLYHANIENTDTVDYLVKKIQPEIIIHLASFPRQKVVNQRPAAGADAMIRGLINLLESATRYHCRRFVYVSSSMVYGDFAPGAVESAPCRPRGQYGIMKLAGEWLVTDYADRTGMQSVIVRPSAVYGPRDVEDRVVSKFLTAAIKKQSIPVRGAQETLDFTYVDDAADGIVAAAVQDCAAGNIYNITRGHGRTLLDAAQLAVDIAGGGEIELCAADPAFPQRNTLNIDAARRDLGFSPGVDIEQGFQLYHDWLVHTLCRS